MRDLAATLLARRDVILDAWRAAGDAEGRSPLASSLSRVQFNDHIPAVLDCLAHTIEATPGVVDEADAALRSGSVCEHGLQRWQQGYPLRDLIREWGHLQICVNEELERYAEAHPSLEPEVMPAARRAWTQLCADGVTESATEYWHLHQTESAGHVHDLERAMEALLTIERERAEGWRVATHDLRGSVTVVKSAATLLNGHGAALDDPARAEVTSVLNSSIASLHEMLNDLLGLARLEAGHDERTLTTFDAAELFRDFCDAAEAAAADRGLFLRAEGPPSLVIQSDRSKLLRILQNLFLNAVKYTPRGGIAVTWDLDSGRDTDRWTFSVQDTGPGIDENHAAPFAQELHDATNVADDARNTSTERRRDLAAAATLQSESDSLRSVQPGEGVGLSIVKRLCELLDASLELATSPGQGTTFRVILPRAYASPPS